MTARTTDPATSHLGAAYIDGKLPGLRDAFMQCLRILGPSTANEIARHAVTSGIAANAESVRKRAGELMRDGLIERGPERYCEVTKQLAGTMRLSNGNTTRERSTQPNTDGRTSAGNPRRAGLDNQSEAGDGVQGLRHGNQQHSQTQDVPTPDTQRIKAVAEFVSREREWIDNWRVALDISIAMKAGADWPAGSSDDYVRAMDAAAAQGLIEREGQKVRAKRVENVAKAVQKGLFE